jgi:hypothetical protein
VQAFARAIRLGGKVLEAHRGVDQITQDQPRDMRFAIQECSRCFVEHSLGERRLARRAFLDRLLKIACQSHLPNS